LPGAVLLWYTTGLMLAQEDRLNAHPEPHAAKVARIADQIREGLARGQHVHITKDSVHHVVPLPGDTRFKDRPVNISSLREVLDVDAERREAVVEPGVTFRQLVAATLRHGLIPTVVPELEGITVGGAVAGGSVEAMSYRYGGFHDACLEYELISGEGEVITCSPQEKPELFHMVHGSYGTLAVLTRLRCKLVPAGPYVKMTYHHHRTFETFQAEMQQRCAAADFDLVDGIIHAPDHLVLCLGQFVDQAPRASDYTREEIYYKSTARLHTDYLTTMDYCFRYDTECHWLTATLPPLQWRLVRRLLGKQLLGSTNLITWSNRLAPLMKLKRRPDVVCDVFIPSAHFERFYRWYVETFDFWPLWIVPYRPPTLYPWINEQHGQAMQDAMPDGLIIDCAVYGKANTDPGVDLSESLERKTYELAGLKTLISRNHHTPEAFWQVYHQEHYQKAKMRLDPQGIFPDLCETFARVQ